MSETREFFTRVFRPRRAFAIFAAAISGWLWPEGFLGQQRGHAIVSIIVQKFGGTSVANAERIRAAAQRAVDAKRKGHQVVMVISARGLKTDELVDLANEISANPPAREMDMLLATGEQEAVALVAMAIQELGEPAVSLTGAQIGVLTDNTFTKARIKKISTERMRKALGEGKIVVAAGFQGIDDDFNITTLGRGGSDTTATALAAVLQAEECEIYTDVEGIFTTDPRIVKNARKLSRISYDEMLELTSLGGGKMHSRSIEFAKKYRVRLRVRPGFNDTLGTLICPEADDDGPAVTGLALVKDEVRVSLCDIPDRPGVMSLIFTKMAERKIPIDMVVQDVASGGLAQVSFTIPQNDFAETLTAAEEAVTELGSGSVQHGTNLAKVSCVGTGMRHHTGVAASFFQALAAKRISIGMITTGDIKISCLVDRTQGPAALIAVHDGFKLDEETAVAPPVGWETPDDSPDAIDRARDELERDVVSKLAHMEDIVVSEVLLDLDQARVTVRNLPDEPGVAATIFTAAAEGAVMVDMIVQNISQRGHANLSFTVLRKDLDQCLLLVREALEPWRDAALSFEREIAKLSVMGIGLRSHTGVGEKMFRALAGANVNIQMISTSEIRISAVVSPSDGQRALDALLTTFNL